MSFVLTLVTARALLDNILGPRLAAKEEPKAGHRITEEKVNELARQMNMNNRISVAHGYIKSVGADLLGMGAIFYPYDLNDAYGNPLKGGEIFVRKELTRIQNNDHLSNPLAFAISYYMTSKWISPLAMAQKDVSRPMMRTAGRSAASFAVGYVAYRVIDYLSEKRAEQTALELSDKGEIMLFRRNLQMQIIDRDEFIYKYNDDVIMTMFLKGSVFMDTPFYPMTLEGRVERANRHLADREKPKI
ncbi:MAG TPA: hypothetical protein VLG49_03910 [Rhabdochlamydiaceae bacterium]|nr:hypothetical protein [Rhabdochlamydiaceae bacterium]